MIYFLFAIMGAVLGLVGGGGAILTIPILMTFGGLSIVEAGTASLLIVGVLSVVGAAQGFIKKEIRMRPLIEVFLVTGAGVAFARLGLVPALPRTPETESWIRAALSILLLIVGYKMIKSTFKSQTLNAPGAIAQKTSKSARMLLLVRLFAVGILTGFLGAGGGFLMIPVLVSLYQMPLKTAVPTSMALVALNTLFGFALSSPTLDQTLSLAPYAMVGVAGLAGGITLRERAPELWLKRGFGILAIAVGVSLKFI